MLPIRKVLCAHAMRWRRVAQDLNYEMAMKEKDMTHMVLEVIVQVPISCDRYGLLTWMTIAASQDQI